MIPLILYASHFRYGSISWTNASGNTVIYKISQAWRGDAFGSFPSIGQVVNTGEFFNFGDGTGTTILITVTSVNPGENWFYGEFSVSHTYPTPGNYSAYDASCCRISTLVNNADGNFQILTTVNVGSGNSSPVSSLVPIIDVPANNSAATFPIPASDPNGSTLSYRLSTSAEAGPGFSQPSGLSINSTTGLMTFNTVGKSNGQLYSAQIMISDGSVMVPLDFIIRISNNTAGTAPFFVAPPTPPNATVFTVVAGNNLSFTIQARDNDAGNTVTLSVAGAPIGSSFTPPLPTSGNPVSTVFSWTPTTSNLGTYVLNFNAQDNTLRSANTSVTINVVNAGPVYYSKATGDLHNVLTWGLNNDGSGPNPTDFSDSTFQLANRSSGLYTMTANWTVGGTINIPSGSQLQLNGFSLGLTTKAGAGTFSGTAASNLTTLSSATPVELNFTTGSEMLNNLTISSGSAATLMTVLNLYNVLTINGNFTLEHQHYPLLIFKSTAANTARIAPVTGIFTQNANSQVERYIPARRAWRILSAPVGGITTGAAVGEAALTTTQETVQAPLIYSNGTPRPQSYGAATFSLNASQTAMTMTATIYNIDITGSQTPDINDNLVAAHIHVGAPLGANAPVRWGFFGSPDNDINPKQLVITPFASGVGGMFTSTWDLPEGNAGTTLTTNLPGILAGLSYINFHTTQFGGGEIRGQISMVGAGTQTINQAWQEGAILGLSPNPNPFPGYGTHITGGPIYGSVANGFDQNPIPGAASSIKRYNGIINNWEEVPNTNATLVGSDAFMTFIRGDRSISLSYNNVPPTATTLRAQGPLKVGDQVFQVSGNGFTAIPNPFASPINFATLTRSGVQNNFYVWDPKMGGEYGVGAYVLLSDNGMGGYNITPAPVSPESQYIQSGQGFLVRPAVAGTPGSITIKESDKSATAATDVFRASDGRTVNNAVRFVDANSGQGWRITLKSMASDGATPVLDEVLVSYHPLYKAALDDLDAVKMENVQENLGAVHDNQVLMVERKPLPQENDVVGLKLWNTKAQTYLLEVNPVNLSGTGLSAWLEDKYLKTSVPVNLSEKLQVSFTITSNPASARTDRFRVIVGKNLSPDVVMNKSSVLAYPNPVNAHLLNLAFANKAQGNYQVTVSNGVGQIMLRKSVQHSGGTISHALPLPATFIKGIYQVRVSGPEGETSFSISIN